MSGHSKWSEIKHKRDIMPMKKYADGEGKLEVLRGHEAETLARFERKVGKVFTEFEDAERKELHKLLAEAKKLNEQDDKAAADATKSEQSDSDVDSGTASTSSDK